MIATPIVIARVIWFVEQTTVVQDGPLILIAAQRGSKKFQHMNLALEQLF